MASEYNDQGEEVRRSLTFKTKPGLHFGGKTSTEEKTKNAVTKKPTKASQKDDTLAKEDK